MAHNKATIYSNGIADFQRVYKVMEGNANKISIPVRQQHLGDVLASLTISGNVTILAPPSYQPANLDDGNLTISTSSAILDLARQLSGAEIKVTAGNSETCGKLVGIHQYEVASAGEPIKEDSIVILNELGLSQLPINQIETLQFIDETIQAEIDKALSRRLREIKPNSTFVDLVLGSEDGENDAFIQYTIPAAAWKISYRILIHQDGPIEFHGHAIVDNNTDEDWKDFFVAVVMGQPISFTTDLADSKTPSRSHVNVVQDSALGAVEVEESVEEFRAEPVMAAAMPDRGNRVGSAAPARARMKRKSTGARGETAKQQTSEVTETGDFCIFESANPVSIDANRSAVIPVFVTNLDESKPVLHFNAENHGERPFRTLKFKNTTEHSLGRGVCTVYDGTTYAGSCILPATKPDGDALLPHALETSVRVTVERKSTKNRRIGIRISDGVVYESYHQTARKDYVIRNRRDDSFEFLLDHHERLNECEYEVTHIVEGGEATPLEGEKLKSGRRFNFPLGKKQNVKVTVVESSVRKATVVLAGSKIDDNLNALWLDDHIVDSNTSLANDEGVAECIRVKTEMDKVQKEIGKANAEVKRITNRQVRLRENIKTGSAAQQTAKWQSDLAAAEDKLVQIEEQRIPELTKEHQTLNEELYEKLKSLALEWNE